MESLGADRVRLRIQAGLWPAEYMELALDWLALKEAEAARQAGADRANTARVASRQNTRDNIAQIAAIIAAVTGAVSALVSFLDWLKVRP